MQYQLARYHAGDPILCRDGTHPMPGPDRPPFVVGIERLIDENRARSQGTKFRICGLPSELSNGPGGGQIGTVRKESQRTQRRKNLTQREDRLDVTIRKDRKVFDLSSAERPQRQGMNQKTDRHSH